MKVTLDRGSAPNDGTGTDLYVATGQLNDMFTELYRGGEFDSAGRVVWPGTGGAETITSDASGEIQTIQKTVGATTYTKTFVYTESFHVSTITATDGTNTWVKTYTYNAVSDLLEGVSDWVLQ